MPFPMVPAPTTPITLIKKILLGFRLQTAGFRRQALSLAIPKPTAQSL
jgi:hypothetical protein